MKQLPLNFETRTALGREDFLVSDANEAAVAWIDRWPDWPGPFLLIIGPERSGKTHLSHVWAEKSGAAVLTLADLGALDINAMTEIASQPILLEDLGTQMEEQKLFHLYNLVKEKGGFLLMTAPEPVSEWGLQLPDLKSRMGAVQIVRIGEPDDALFGAVFLKLFTDRQLQVSPELLQYLITRLERSFEAANTIVEKIDRLSLAEKRDITIPLVRSILDKEET
ncbi:MAG: hypothetical protein JJ879_08855 [Sneathiella sp.]|nr:hypothetical protein [Sneathiella sp.]